MRPILSGMTILALLGGISSSLAAVPPPLPAEHLSVEKLGPVGPHWVYVFDEALLNEIDMRVLLFDADSNRRLGQIGAGFMAGVNLSPDGKTTVVATTYFARGGHGARTDVAEFNDNSTLAKTGEIVLPPKRAQTFPMLFDVAYSSDARFLYVAYLTPAASIGVLDPAKKAVLGEIDTAGCTLVIPWGPNHVSSLCESGRLLTVTLDASGHEAARATSEPFFDPDRDPIFVQGIRTSEGYAFVSFLGEVHEVDFTHAAPTFRAPWSLVTAAEKGTWRPGSVQVGTVQRAFGKLYVSMHRGGDGSHKDYGTEIWVFDLKTHQRTARWGFNTKDWGAITALHVTQDRSPLLFAATERADLVVMDAQTGKTRHVEPQVGQSPWLLMGP